METIKIGDVVRTSNGNVGIVKRIKTKEIGYFDKQWIPIKVYDDPIMCPPQINLSMIEEGLVGKEIKIREFKYKILFDGYEFDVDDDSEDLLKLKTVIIEMRNSVIFTLKLKAETVAQFVEVLMLNHQSYTLR